MGLLSVPLILKAFGRKKKEGRLCHRSGHNESMCLKGCPSLSLVWMVVCIARFYYHIISELAFVLDETLR